MKIDFSKITGKIIENEQIKGTGFLMNTKWFVTARHNLLEPLQEVIEEKKVIIDFESTGEITGKTVNLKEANEKNIDCVFIYLDEEVLDVSLTKAIVSKTSIKGFGCNIYGYPKEYLQGLNLRGTVLSNIKEQYKNIDILLKVDKKDTLQSYKGLSGSPIVIGGFIVGIILQQETSENLFGISFDLISKVFDNKVLEVEEKELKNILLSQNDNLEEMLSFEFFNDHIGEATRIAGPRYTKQLNLENKTFQDLLVFAKEEMALDKPKEVIETLEEFPRRLENCINKDKINQAMQFGLNSKPIIEETINLINEILNNFRDIVISGFLNEKMNFFGNINIRIENIVKQLDIVFEKELEIFEQENGLSTYNNKSWRGWMASYQCQFPCANLDTIKDLIKNLKDLQEFFRMNPVMLYFSNNLLVQGKGGTGKTHSLCDLVNRNIQQGIPNLLFFGQYFKNKSPEETILEKLSIKGVSFDDFLYSLDLIGDRLKKPVIICIDALNETTDKNYWNENLSSFSEKIKKYKNIKLIVTCRTLYLSEILNEDIENRFLAIEHIGFEGLEYQAVNAFFKYYKLNIPSANKMQMEYSNPLFLKLYCETLVDTRDEEQVLDIEDLADLIEHFLRTKNEKISKKFSDYISPKDNIVFHCINEVAKEMYKNNTNFLKWSKLKQIIAEVITSIGLDSTLLAKVILDEFISEHIIKEDIFDEDTISFSFERFYDYIMAKNVIEEEHEQLLDRVDELTRNVEIYRGTLEVLATLYKEKYGQEIRSFQGVKAGKLGKIWLDSLAWRRTEQIDDETREILYEFLTSQTLSEEAFITIFELALRKKCMINAQYLHGLLIGQTMAQRDVFLGYVMLKAYEKHAIVNKLLKNAIYLTETEIDIEIIRLWVLALGWFTSSNDIYIRDLASKGLVNLVNLYPDSIFYLIKNFEEVDDDYIQERMWGAIYASLILNRNEEKLKAVIKYIYEKYVQSKNFPTNVLIRNCLRNIAEFANYYNRLEYNIINFRPSYKSKTVKKLKDSFVNSIKNKWDRLYWNCTESDFGIYTIPRGDSNNYGFNKKEVGSLIYNEIIRMGYSKKHEELDKYIDYTYGSLRSRDSSVERIGKKYQKIALYNVMGRIYDNYKYKPRHTSNEEKEIIPKEQGNRFREIDLSCVPYNNLVQDFVGKKLKYDFRRTKKLSYLEWFKKEDLKNIVKEVIEVDYDNEKYLLLKGYFSLSYREDVISKYPIRQIWTHIYSYLVKNEDVSIIEKWLKEEAYSGEWLSHGDNSFYEGWIGEYPWAASYVNNLDSYDTATARFGPSRIPVTIIPTVIDYNNEKDSDFLSFEIGKGFLFPNRRFLKELNLVWNGQNLFKCDSKLAFINGKNRSGDLYVNKEVLDEYLEKNGLSLFWAAIGEKQVITGNLSSRFEGRAEISESYIYEQKKLIRNHYNYNLLPPHE